MLGTDLLAQNPTLLIVAFGSIELFHCWFGLTTTIPEAALNCAFQPLVIDEPLVDKVATQELGTLPVLVISNVAQ
jgi:hypothetical protein